MNATRPDSRTRFLDAALRVIREQGYQAATVDDLCEAAGLTKGSFFHHFESKEVLGLAAADHFAEMAQGLVASAEYHSLDDPRDRVLAYVDLRAEWIAGEIPDFTCLLGTIVQECYDSHPALREACGRHIREHADLVTRDLAEAKERYAPEAAWTPESLALHTQTVIQGAFILAKAARDPEVARDSLSHLRRYLEAQLGITLHPTTTEESLQ